MLVTDHARVEETLYAPSRGRYERLADRIDSRSRLLWVSETEIVSDIFRFKLPRCLPPSFRGHLFSVVYGVALGWQVKAEDAVSYETLFFECTGDTEIAADFHFPTERPLRAVDLWSLYQKTWLRFSTFERSAETRVFDLQDERSALCRVELTGEWLESGVCLVRGGEAMPAKAVFSSSRRGHFVAKILQWEQKGEKRRVSAEISRVADAFGEVHLRLFIPGSAPRGFVLGDMVVTYELVLEISPGETQGVVVWRTGLGIH